MNERSKNQKRNKTRLHIINSAVKLFVNFGIQGTSMQLLAQHANIATGSLYNYFENKEMLIHDIYQHHVNEEKEYLLLSYDEDKSLYERLSHIVSQSIHYKFNNPDVFHFRNQCQHSPSVLKGMQNSEYYTNHPLEKIAFEGQAQGLFNPLSLQELFYFTHAGALGYIGWKIFSKDSLSDKDIVNLINLCWDSLLLNESHNATEKSNIIY